MWLIKIEKIYASVLGKVLFFNYQRLCPWKNTKKNQHLNPPKVPIQIQMWLLEILIKKTSFGSFNSNPLLDPL